MAGAVLLQVLPQETRELKDCGETCSGVYAVYFIIFFMLWKMLVYLTSTALSICLHVI